MRATIAGPPPDAIASCDDDDQRKVPPLPRRGAASTQSCAAGVCYPMVARDQRWPHTHGRNSEPACTGWSESSPALHEVRTSLFGVGEGVCGTDFRALSCKWRWRDPGALSGLGARVRDLRFVA